MSKNINAKDTAKRLATYSNGLVHVYDQLTIDKADNERYPVSPLNNGYGFQELYSSITSVKSAYIVRTNHNGFVMEKLTINN